jgi:hypothetical protein
VVSHIVHAGVSKWILVNPVFGHVGVSIIFIYKVDAIFSSSDAGSRERLGAALAKEERTPHQSFNLYPPFMACLEDLKPVSLLVS